MLGACFGGVLNIPTKKALMFETKCPRCDKAFNILKHLRISLMIRYVGVFFLTITCPNCKLEVLSSDETAYDGEIL